VFYCVNPRLDAVLASQDGRLCHRSFCLAHRSRKAFRPKWQACPYQLAD
jgi:histidinol phosphatase-like enzyme